MGCGCVGGMWLVRFNCRVERERERERAAMRFSCFELINVAWSYFERSAGGDECERCERCRVGRFEIATSGAAFGRFVGSLNRRMFVSLTLFVTLKLTGDEDDGW